MHGASKRRAGLRVGHSRFRAVPALVLAVAIGPNFAPGPAIADAPAAAAVPVAAAAPTAAGVPALAADTVAGSPTALSLTVYRAPERSAGSIDLDRLGGFALISETRTVHLLAGVNRVRFEGVADGIEPASAMVTGLDQGVIEKNREGRVLSPAALVAAAVGRSVTLLRTEKSGKLTRTAGTIRSDAQGGVVFDTAQGVEALRCSGLPETFSFTGVTDLAATPTLSVRVRSSRPVTRTVTLAYLAGGFDWAADYSAGLSADGKSMDLGAWVTLANGNGTGFPDAHTQVVAGRVNRESGEVEPLDRGGPILAQCWPRGSTSDSPQYLQMARAAVQGIGQTRAFKLMMPASAPAPLEEDMVTAAHRVEQETLGDLKLYRVPEETTVAARQSKQVRLLDRSAIPVSFVYGADLAAGEASQTAATVLLRTMNTRANHLGLPLPSGRVAVFSLRDGRRLLRHESDLRDLAADEEVEIGMGESPDVQVVADKDSVAVSNARAAAIQFELRLRLPPGARIVRADHPVGAKNGRPIFRLSIPPRKTVTVRYQIRTTVH